MSTWNTPPPGHLMACGHSVCSTANISGPGSCDPSHPQPGAVAGTWPQAISDPGARPPQENSAGTGAGLGSSLGCGWHEVCAPAVLAAGARAGQVCAAARAALALLWGHGDCRQLGVSRVGSGGIHTTDSGEHPGWGGEGPADQVASKADLGCGMWSHAGAFASRSLLWPSSLQAPAAWTTLWRPWPGPGAHRSPRRPRDRGQGRSESLPHTPPYGLSRLSVSEPPSPRPTRWPVLCPERPRQTHGFRQPASPGSCTWGAHWEGGPSASSAGSGRGHPPTWACPPSSARPDEGEFWGLTDAKSRGSQVQRCRGQGGSPRGKQESRPGQPLPGAPSSGEPRAPPGVATTRSATARSGSGRSGLSTAGAGA